MAASNATKTALVLGVANGRSIAWACVRSLLAQNYHVVFTYQNQRFEKTALDLCAKEMVQQPSAKLQCLPCQVESEIPALFEERLPEVMSSEGGLDTIVHSIAYAPPSAMKEGSLLDTSREDFLVAHAISAYSFLEVARHSTPFLNTSGSSLTALSYLGATRAVKNYNVMGPAKASLEALVRGLALEMGPSTRVNAVSAGPVNTMAARGIAGFSSIRSDVEQRAPLGRNVTVDEVADTVTFLASASGITGQTIYVDGGYSIVAGPADQSTKNEER